MSTLKDKFGRKHDYLRISLVDKCNLRCTYCMPENIRFLPSHRLMTAQEILEISEIFTHQLGVKKIRVTGGEPLLRKDAPEILEGLGKLPVELAITTNALLLHNFLDQFEEIGLRSLNISLDSFNKERFKQMTRRDELDRVLENIDLARGRGLRVKINMVVVNGENDDELLDFVERTKEEELHVRFIEFMPFDGNQWHWEKVLPFQQMLERIEEKYEVEKLNDAPHSTSKAYQVKGYKGTFAVISSVTHPFCGNCNRIRLTAEGKLRNCLFATSETDLLTPHRAGADLLPLIQEAIGAKHFELGGLPDFQDRDALLDNLSDRSMVKIGG